MEVTHNRQARVVVNVILRAILEVGRGVTSYTVALGTEHIIVILIGAIAGGFVSGLAGFGTGITALGIWLYVMPPSLAASLVIICSVVSNLQTLPTICRTIEVKRSLAFILPGLIGVPIGVALLSLIDTRLLNVGIGVLLLSFALFVLLYRSNAVNAWGGRLADGAIGFGGGILGGLAGLSGPLPTMWASFRGWKKNESRGVFQAFNLCILTIALLTHAVAGYLTWELAWAVLAALPGTVLGSWVGIRVYRRLSDQRFRTLILALLCFAGANLIRTNL
jgi:uncharacterized protein